MFSRFLNTNDYKSIVTEEALDQLIRGSEERLEQAEEAAEQSVVEYLTLNYEVERELEIGKNLLPYNPQFTYPSGAHFYLDGKIYQTLKSISGIKAPVHVEYWREYIEPITDDTEVKQYTQRHNFNPGDIVAFGVGRFYECQEYNGPDFNNIRIPGVCAWAEIKYIDEWEANLEYTQWAVVSFEGKYFTLMNYYPNRNLVKNPMASDDWGMIGDYDPNYTYELSDHEYVVYEGSVYYPIMNPNADDVKINVNIKSHDPRNPNLKKHILRLAVYELHKLISPTNVSSARITDYETTIIWLRDASRLKLNPGIPRKLDREKKPITDFATATYMRSYDPYENMWHV